MVSQPTIGMGTGRTRRGEWTPRIFGPAIGLLIAVALFLFRRSRPRRLAWAQRQAGGRAAQPTIAHVVNAPQILRWFFLGQTAYMRARGLRTHVFSSPGPELEAFAQAERVGVTAMEITRQITPHQDFVTIVHLTRALRQLRPAIVDAHTPKGGLLGMIAATLAGVPVRVYHLRGLRLDTAAGMQRLILLASERVSCFLAHRVICVSHSVREAALALGLCPPEKITVLGHGSGNGVDASGRFDPERLSLEARCAVRSQLGIPDEALVIGFVGRVVRDKGLTELADAWRALRAEDASLHLLVIGPFEPYDPLSPDTAALLRQDQRIHLTGPVDDTAPLYAAMDLVVLPTYREGFPNVLLEAAAMALPVVATRVAGCVDAVQDGLTGTLVPPRDADALAAAIRRYVADPGLRRRHGAAARQRVLHDFRQDAIWEALYEEYARLLRAQGVRIDVDVPASPTLAAPAPVQRAVAQSRIKRSLDVIGALAGMVMLAPIVAGVAAAIWWRMGRPVLFRHVRAGHDGRPFAVVKLRTMRDANGPDGRLLSDEERVTPLGWFLRRTSLDELPQLWNVLRGEMSLVGPRPLEDWYLPLYRERERLRLAVRPGITGLAQISGRNMLPWDERLELDARYVEEWSLWLDARILLRTVLMLCGGKGVTRDPVAEGDLRQLRSTAEIVAGVQGHVANGRDMNDPRNTASRTEGVARESVDGI
jgi:lipopolysaccharide/colanic/teichoic acid biosynthesis glycosyltransferase/glycosyltransferase involved in cell wall biosynthesis